MMRLSILRLLTLALPVPLCTPGAVAQAGSWSHEFDTPGLLGRVFALTTYQGALYAGGDSLQSDGAFLGNLAKFDGVEWKAVPGASIFGEVRTFEVLGDDLIVGGDFSGLPGLAAPNIARFDGSTWTDVGGGVNGWVFALEAYQGDLYAGGFFTLAGGVAATGIARFDGAQWNAVGGGVAGVFGRNVWSLETGPDGRLYVGGQFDTAGGVASKSLASWNGSSWGSVGGGIDSPVNGIVEAITWYGGELHVGGLFGTAGGVLVDNIARFDGSWHALAGGIPDWSISSDVNTLCVFDGSLYVGGDFIQAGSVSTRAIARWDGAQWNGLGGVDGSVLKTNVFALHEHAGELIVGGEFTRAGTDLSAGQAIVSNSVAGFDGTSWRELGQGLGFDAEVRDAVAWNGGIAAVGRFIEAGKSLSSQVAFFDGSDWNFLGLVDNNVNAACVFEGDLVITGDFSSVEGLPISGIARFDGANWSGFGTGAGGDALAVYQGQLYSGGLGGPRRWNGTTWDTFGITGASGPNWVLAMHAHTDGKLYVGGTASGANPRIFSWDGTSMQPLGAGVNDIVECMVSYQGDLLVGGWFTQAGGSPANTLARWDGSGWSEFGDLTGALVKSLTMFQGDLYAGGDLVAFSGNDADSIARFNGSGWDSLGLGLNGTPFALVPDDAAGKLYVGGLFTKADDPNVFGQGIPSFYFGAWEAMAAEPFSSYCVPKPSSQGCAGTIAGTGLPSLTLPVPFDISVDEVLNQKNGLLFYGFAASALPFQGGTLCVQPPLRRTAVQGSGGNSPLDDCSGAFTFDFNAYAQAGADPMLTAGTDVFTQYWYRDPADAAGFGSGLSNALQLELQL